MPTKMKYLIALLLSMPFMSTNLIANDTLHEANKAAFFATIAANDKASKLVALPRHLKIEYLSATLLGSPYVDGSLGEGDQGKYDKDPLVRFDVFDCTTYVEAVLAGAISTSPDEFMQNLIKLRYKAGDVSFVTRNHFPSLDWIPNNKSHLMDITDQIAGKFVKIANTVIDKPAWYEKMTVDRLSCPDETSITCNALLQQLQAEGKTFRPETVATPYVPLTALYLNNKTANLALLDRIPSGSVINMVRPNWDIKKWIGTNMNISHQSIAIRHGDTLFLRHASQTHKRVIDVHFLEYFSEYDETSSLKGFNVQALN
ncbi:N-acetylmuramoyl-L-alanine amidase-like domain-containing protein [Marinomonas algicola]|uniref:N-acetylmuramoyl-L-alanine amidase-like domain-containing protein n=1 Tax=Marinomonas algicola TaxID=2773454 RepID=UPI001EFF4693|nr:N-acetylmuramoyl-L-alanine amidase-like domain-containing protein [Marinomonas algicola]